MKKTKNLEMGDYIYIWKNGDKTQEFKRKIIKKKALYAYWIKGGGPYYEDANHDDEVWCREGDCVFDKKKNTDKENS